MIHIKKELNSKTRNKIIEDKETINLTGAKSTNQRIKQRKYLKIESKANEVMDGIIYIGLVLILIACILIGVLKGLIHFHDIIQPVEAKEVVEVIKPTVSKMESVEVKIPTIGSHIQLTSAKEEIIRPIESNGTYIEHKTDEYVINKTIEFLKEAEGIRLVAYPDFKQWSICFGTKSYKGETVTLEECENRLRVRVQSELLRVNRMGDNLSWNKKVALISFMYNTGYNYKILNYAARGDDDSVNYLVLQYNVAGGKFNQGLQNRRYKEMNLYLGR